MYSVLPVLQSLCMLVSFQVDMQCNVHKKIFRAMASSFNQIVSGFFDFMNIAVHNQNIQTLIYFAFTIE